MFLSEKLQHCKILGILLYLIQKYKCIIIIAQLFSGNNTDVQIKIISSINITEYVWALIVFREIYFYKIREKLLSDFADNI